MITIDPHVALLLVMTTGVGFVMALAGTQKGALEWRRQRRLCPACGRQLDRRRCGNCER